MQMSYAHSTKIVQFNWDHSYLALVIHELSTVLTIYDSPDLNIGIHIPLLFEMVSGYYAFPYQPCMGTLKFQGHWEVVLLSGKGYAKRSQI